MDVILSREATKGSLSIQGFNDPGAKAILSSPIASLRLPQDDATGPTASLGFLRMTRRGRPLRFGLLA
jgi:hypothetical protein